MEIKSRLHNPELWGGIECTVNRVGNVYRDQLADTGHYDRPGDIKLFAKLGIKKLRYPILWENHQPGEDGQIDWNRTTAALTDLQKENVIPIAGLLHHGSGPLHTSLLDADFPDKLAAHAHAVAMQFPWLEYYTPVNEPLTTARFSGLYGLWYPHQQQEKSFVRMLLNQLKGTVLAMEAIRKINPAAKLVQTEDLCKIHSTELLYYQAAFENERRWLTYDLLCGHFKPGHLFWNHFISLGIPQQDLDFFATHACPPDIIGFNYYITSERFLDHRLQHYPVHLHGGNGRHHYVDTEAVRAGKCAGITALLLEAWDRYHVPMAITECYLNCSREEQLRWFQETWNACCQLNEQGIPLKAVTAWSLLGSFDWDSLLLQQQGHYEPGVFDIRNGAPRPTILAKMIHSLSLGKSFEHPVLNGKGWWHKHSEPAETFRNNRPLLIIHHDPDAAEKFEGACRESRIFYYTISSPDLLKSDCQPWGIVMALNDQQEDWTAVYEKTTAFARRSGIPAMAITASYHHLLSGDFLSIVHDGFDGMKFASHAMDLFLDGEKGIWQWNREKIVKVMARNAALAH